MGKSFWADVGYAGEVAARLLVAVFCDEVDFVCDVVGVVFVFFVEEDVFDDELFDVDLLDFEVVPDELPDVPVLVKYQYQPFDESPLDFKLEDAPNPELVLVVVSPPGLVEDVFDDELVVRPGVVDEFDDEVAVDVDEVPELVVEVPAN